MRRKAMLILFALVLISNISIYSQEQNPTQYALKVMDALKASDLKAFTDMMHPEALRQFKLLLLGIIKQDKAMEFGRMFFNVKSISDFEKISEWDIYYLFMAKIYEMVPTLKETLVSSNIEVIGFVLENDNIAHVVYRFTSTVDMINASKVSVITLLKYNDEWRAALAGNIGDIAEQLKNEF